jgi:hypothetical protein
LGLENPLSSHSSPVGSCSHLLYIHVLKLFEFVHFIIIPGLLGFAYPIVHPHVMVFEFSMLMFLMFLVFLLLQGGNMV